MSRHDVALYWLSALRRLSVSLLADILEVSLEISQMTLHDLVRDGRCRWDSEQEVVIIDGMLPKRFHHRSPPN